MNVANDANITPAIDDLHILFSQLNTQQVETFYKHYQQWQLEQQSIVLQEKIAAIEQQIVDNSVLMQLAQPSPIALATLIRLQSYGVDDVDLLDRMLERGDTWLDHTLQLLEQCERLDVIHGNYTEWCQHALEDAYNWLDSMHNDELPMLERATQAETGDDTTEALLIQRLMSEDETVKVPTSKSLSPMIASQEETKLVESDVSCPSRVSITEEGRDTSGPTDACPIPSILSYFTAVETYSTDLIQSQEDIPVHETRAEEKQQKSPKHGLVSRILARVWQT